jgi:hypothetical protein
MKSSRAPLVMMFAFASSAAWSGHLSIDCPLCHQRIRLKDTAMRTALLISLTLSTRTPSCALKKYIQWNNLTHKT